MFNISLSGYDIYVAAQDEERAKDCNLIYAFIALTLLVITFVLLFSRNKQ